MSSKFSTGFFSDTSSIFLFPLFITAFPVFFFVLDVRVLADISGFSSRLLLSGSTWLWVREGETTIFYKWKITDEPGSISCVFWFFVDSFCWMFLGFLNLLGNFSPYFSLACDNFFELFKEPSPYSKESATWVIY